MARTREFDTEKAVEAAMAAFRFKGYAGTSIQDLVEATGLGRGSLYAAFGSKEGLYLQVLDMYRARYAAPLVEMLRAGVPARELIGEVLTGLVDEIVRDGRRQACLVVGAAMELAHRDAAIAGRLRSITSSLEDALFEVILEARRTGELSGSGPARDVARSLVLTMQGMRVMGAIDPSRESLMASVRLCLDSLD